MILYSGIGEAYYSNKLNDFICDMVEASYSNTTNDSICGMVGVS
jgi:hypothetical protein